MTKSTIPAILENILKNQSRAKFFLNVKFKIRTRGNSKTRTRGTQQKYPQHFIVRCLYVIDRHENP